MQITPKQVRRISDQFGQASQESQQMVSILKDAVNALFPGLEDPSQIYFSKNMKMWCTGMEQCIQMLQQISKDFDVIADLFEKVDNGPQHFA